MLVLTRSVGETIHIGDDVTITVLEVRANSVRIGIEAPRDITVTRGEHHQADHPAAEEPV